MSIFSEVVQDAGIGMSSLCLLGPKWKYYIYGTKLNQYGTTMLYIC